MPMQQCFGEVSKNFVVTNKMHLELLKREAIIQSYRRDR